MKEQEDAQYKHTDQQTFSDTEQVHTALWLTHDMTLPRLCSCGLYAPPPSLTSSNASLNLMTELQNVTVWWTNVSLSPLLIFTLCPSTPLKTRSFLCKREITGLTCFGWEKQWSQREIGCFRGEKHSCGADRRGSEAGRGLQDCEGATLEGTLEETEPDCVDMENDETEPEERTEEMAEGNTGVRMFGD